MKRIKHGMIVGAAALLLMTGCGSNASTADLQKQIERLEAENAELKEQLNEPQEINVDESFDDGTTNASEQETAVESVDYASMMTNPQEVFFSSVGVFNDISELQAGDLVDVTIEEHYLDELSPILVIENVPVAGSNPDGVGLYLEIDDAEITNKVIRGGYRITLSKKTDISNINQVAVITTNKVIYLAPLPEGETEDYEVWFPEGTGCSIKVISKSKDSDGQIALIIGDKTYQFTVDAVEGIYKCDVKGTYEKGTLSISGIDDYSVEYSNCGPYDLYYPNN